MALRIHVEAPAKVNLYLGVYTQKDERGYHRVDSVMAALGLADELLVEEAPLLSLRCEPDLGIDPARNLCWKAAERLAEAFGVEPKARISVTKRIPSQAGLGGGSSDAAATLLALCRLWGLDEQDARLFEVARSLGADVPFFLDPVPTLLVGAGDVPAERFEASWAVPLVLAQAPGTGVSTPEAYADFDREPPEFPPLEPLLETLRVGETAHLPEVVANNLAPVAERLQPQVGEVRRWLESQSGVEAALVSGSGGCVYGLCRSHDEAVRAADEARAKGWWSCATQLVS